MTFTGAKAAAVEAILKDALSGVAVNAFARGIGLSLHLDHRLAATASGEAAAVADYLRRGLARTVEAGHGDMIALALWRVEAEAGPAIELEVGRSIGKRAQSAARLVDLWSLPLGGVGAEPRPHRQDAGAETLLLPLPITPDADAPLLGDRWRRTFAGRSMLHVGEALLDADRFRASLASIGLEVELSGSPEAALAAARARADAQRPFDLLYIDGLPLEPSEHLAGAFRADPRLAGTLIAYAGIGHDEPRHLRDVPLFDAVRSVARPWRRLIEMMSELIEARGQRAGQKATTRSDAPGIPDLTGRRLLVAEDVETNQALLRAFLEPTGAAVETVSGGQAAIERHVAEPADLIVMDLQMPGMDGITAARRIRALPPPAGEVPILALTAYAGSPDRQRALTAGMNAYLAKPVVMAELYELVMRLLSPAGGTS